MNATGKVIKRKTLLCGLCLMFSLEKCFQKLVFRKLLLQFRCYYDVVVFAVMVHFVLPAWVTLSATGASSSVSSNLV